MTGFAFGDWGRGCYVTDEDWAAVIYRALDISFRGTDKRRTAIRALESKATGIANRRDIRDTADTPEEVVWMLDTLLSVDVRARWDEILTSPDAAEEIARHLGGGNVVMCEVYRQVILDVKRHLLSQGIQRPLSWRDSWVVRGGRRRERLPPCQATG
jgi:hypothetical protein